MGTKSNVLVGVATLAIKNPFDESIAEFDTEHAYAGTYSAKLYKSNSGNDGSTHVQIVPPTGITLAQWTIGAAANQYSWWYWYQALTANWVQAEYRFEDPTDGSEGWVEITCVPHQTHLGTAGWLQYDLATDPVVGFGGWGEHGIGDNFFDWDLGDTVSTVEATINALPQVDNASDWILTRVRYELWEAGPARSAWIDSVEIAGVTYTIEPGGTAPALSFDSGFTEVGYTEDGVDMEYNADTADIDVAEETYPVARPVTKERTSIKCNMAEASLYNLDKAMAGASLSGSIITLGGGVQKEVSLRIVGTSPGGFLRTIYIPKATAVGTSAIPFKKGAKSVVPVEFQALKGDDPACTIIDNAA